MRARCLIAGDPMGKYNDIDSESVGEAITPNGIGKVANETKPVPCRQESHFDNLLAMSLAK